MEFEPNKMCPKIFIAGAPRTGTSILLWAMKAVFGLPGDGESHVLPAINEMIHSFYRYKLAFREVDESVVKYLMLNRVSLAELKIPLFQYIRQLYRKNFPGDKWVDKTPSVSGIYALPIAEEIFPDASLIVTQRTGIETVSSHLRKFGTSFECACDIWVGAMSGIKNIQPLCKQLLVVDQYDFSNATDRVSTAIADHVGLPEKASELAHFLANKRVEVSSTHDHSMRLRLSDVSWSGRQKEIFKTRCEEMMKAYGYEM